VILGGADICALVSDEAVATALGVEMVTSEASSEGTPQCSFTREGDSAGANVVLSVLRRDEDLVGSQGGAAFQRAVDLNRALFPNSTETPIENLASSALFLENQASNLLIVQVGPRVLTVSGEGLTEQASTAIAVLAIENL
jgi:hypothetical protein